MCFLCAEAILDSKRSPPSAGYNCWLGLNVKTGLQGCSGTPNKGYSSFCFVFVASSCQNVIKSTCVCSNINTERGPNWCFRGKICSIRQAEVVNCGRAYLHGGSPLVFWGREVTLDIFTPQTKWWSGDAPPTLWTPFKPCLRAPQAPNGNPSAAQRVSHSKLEGVNQASDTQR